MIYIKYKLDKSKIHGIGLFTDENLKEGKLVYTASPILDVNITRKQFNSLDKKEKREVRWWGFYDAPNNVWHADFDVSKFINHSFKPTLTQGSSHKDAYLIAKKNVKKGEKLTQNYLEFESKEDLRKRGIKVE